jgi:hypothetical protein
MLEEKSNLFKAFRDRKMEQLHELLPSIAPASTLTIQWEEGSAEFLLGPDVRALRTSILEEVAKIFKVRAEDVILRLDCENASVGIRVLNIGFSEIFTPEASGETKTLGVPFEP